MAFTKYATDCGGGSKSQGWKGHAVPCTKENYGRRNYEEAEKLTLDGRLHSVYSRALEGRATHSPSQGPESFWNYPPVLVSKRFSLILLPRSWNYMKLCVSVCFSTITLWNFIYFLCLFLMKRRQCVKNLHSDFLVKTIKMVKKGGRSVIYENSHRRHVVYGPNPSPSTFSIRIKLKSLLKDDHYKYLFMCIFMYIHTYVFCILWYFSYINIAQTIVAAGTWSGLLLYKFPQPQG